MLKKRIIIFIISFLLIFSLVPIFNSTGENKNSPVDFYSEQTNNKHETDYVEEENFEELNIEKKSLNTKIKSKRNVKDISNNYKKIEIGDTVEILTAIDILGEEEYYILAKLLYAEAGSMSWEGQVYVCSATLNLGDLLDRSIWSMAHDVNVMAVAPYVDYKYPMDMQYDVIEYVVCGGGRVEEICYFRTSYYHSFGTPVCSIENVYFSKP